MTKHKTNHSSISKVILRLILLLVSSLPQGLSLSLETRNNLRYKGQALRRMRWKELEDWLSAAIDATTGDHLEP